MKKITKLSAIVISIMVLSFTSFNSFESNAKIITKMNNKLTRVVDNEGSTYQKRLELIYDLDKDDVLDTISIYDYENKTTGYYPHFVEYKLSQLKFKPLKTKFFDMPHPNSLGLDYGVGGICISFYMHGTYIQPCVSLTFEYNEEAKNLQMINVLFEDMLNEICEPYNRRIIANYDYEKWRFRTYVFDVGSEEVFLSEDYLDKKSNKYYTRFLEDQEEELNSFFFSPPKKDIFLNSVSHKIFHELFLPTETPSTRKVTP